MYLRLTTFSKPLPKCQFTYLFLLFLFRSGAPPMTLLTAGALPDKTPAARDSFKRMHQVVAWRGAPPPNQNPGYAGGSPIPSSIFSLSRS